MKINSFLLNKTKSKPMGIKKKGRIRIYYKYLNLNLPLLYTLVHAIQAR